MMQPAYLVLAAVLVTVTWVPATTNTDGTPLPVGRAWTLVEQHQQDCAQVPDDSVPVDGQARPTSSTVVAAQFEQPAGTTWCYVARTVALARPQSAAFVSAPMKVNKTTPRAGGCAGCHQ